MNDMTELLAYSEDDYTTFVRQYNDTTKAQRLAYFGLAKVAQMQERYESEVCCDCQQWTEPNEIDKFDGRCRTCHHEMPMEDCTDPRRGAAAFLNRKFG